MLGEVPTLSGQARLIAVLVVAAGLLAYVQLQAAGLALRDREQRSRWASSGRDVLNLVALAILCGAFVVAGAPFPAALLFAGTLGIVLEVTRLFGRRASVRRRTAVVGLVVGVPIAAMLSDAVAVANRVCAALF